MHNLSYSSLVSLNNVELIKPIPQIAWSLKINALTPADKYVLLNTFFLQQLQKKKKRRQQNKQRKLD